MTVISLEKLNIISKSVISGNLVKAASIYSSIFVAYFVDVTICADEEAETDNGTLSESETERNVEDLSTDVRPFHKLIILLPVCMDVRCLRTVFTYIHLFYVLAKHILKK